MIAWALDLIGGLTLRVKLIALVLITLLTAVGYFWLRWKVSTRKATTMQERAEKLEATRKLEQRIAASRAKTREQQDKLRAQIRARRDRDYFEH